MLAGELCRSACGRKATSASIWTSSQSLITDRTRLIILNSPHNPTGGVLEQTRHRADRAGHRRPQHLGAVRRNLQPPHFRRRQHFSIMSGSWIAGSHHPARRFLEDLRDDWMAHGIRRDALRTLPRTCTRLMTNSNSCTASFTQMAGIEAMRGDQSSVDHMRDEFQRPARRVCRGLEQASRASPAACRRALSTYSRISRQTGWKSKALADALLEQAGVAAFPARRSGNSAKATCDSVWRTLSKICSRHWIASISGPRRICEPAPKNLNTEDKELHLVAGVIQ